VEILNWFPRVVTVWVPLPFDQVLEPMHLTKESVINDGLDFVFRVFVNEVRRRVRVIWSMCGSLSEQDQQRGMKYVMDPPGLGKVELKGDRRDDPFDAEGTLPSRRELV